MSRAAPNRTRVDPSCAHEQRSPCFAAELPRGQRGESLQRDRTRKRRLTADVCLGLVWGIPANWWQNSVAPRSVSRLFQHSPRQLRIARERLEKADSGLQVGIGRAPMIARERSGGTVARLLQRAARI